jgi:quercetin dioxygenase-like cupin family protein/uncharacterized damage-inducible protein DinB
MPDPWTSRRFTFDFPIQRLPVIIDRLRGTADRIEAKLRGVPHSTLTANLGGGWSILENVGHLIDLESLHESRLDQFAARKSDLLAADMENRATWNANHNASTAAALLTRFRAVRGAFIDRLTEWPEERLGDAAMHPRLKQPMRVVDLAYFVAEHDDYHLAQIERRLRAAGEAAPRPATSARWEALPLDCPMPLLERRRILGDMAMISHITLHKGCLVPVHQHANEQFSVVLRGRIRFTLADREVDVTAGEVIHLPSNAPHGAEAMEETEVLDIFAPPSAGTGIDRQSSSR